MVRPKKGRQHGKLFSNQTSETPSEKHNSICKEQDGGFGRGHSEGKPRQESRCWSPTRHTRHMELTDEQRRRIEENRARARARLRERRLGQSQADSGTSGGARVDAAGGADDTTGGSVDPSNSAPRDGGGGGGAAGRRLPDDKGSGAGEGRGSGVGEGAGSAEKGPRGTRAGGGGRRDGLGRVGSGGASGSGEVPAAAAAAAAASCEGCGGAEGDVRVDKELLEGFGVSVCRTCKLSREEFQCVSKKEVKEAYLLPEGTISVLKFIERDNPRHTSWTKVVGVAC